jgi:hypothetical protein
MTTKNYPEATVKETRYVDWDEDTQSYGIFGEESGHCYATYSDKDVAKKALAEWESIRG